MAKSTLQMDPVPWPPKPRGECVVDNVNGVDYVEGGRVRSSYEAKSQDYRSEKLGNRKMPSK